MILLCPPEQSTQFHYPLDPKKIRAEGSMHKDTTYQGSDRQDFYRHGRKKNNTEQMPSIFRLGLPYCNPVISVWTITSHALRMVICPWSIAADRCTTYSEKQISLTRKNRVWKALYIRAQFYSAKRNTGNRSDYSVAARSLRSPVPIIECTIYISKNPRNRL